MNTQPLQRVTSIYRFWILWRGIAGAFLFTLVTGCDRTPSEAGKLGKGAPEGMAASTTRPAFVDATAATGLTFRHFNGMSGQWYMPEMVGAGAALFDFDADGDLDLFLVQGTMLATNLPLPGLSAAQTGSNHHHRLFRNDLTMSADGRSTVHWVDISGEAGLSDLPSDYGMGVAVGDFNNDGFSDLYLANFGPNRLLKNDAGKRLVDVTASVAPGLGDPRWSLGASWFDFDRDGSLDLVVCNYIDFNYSRHRICNSPAGGPNYCGPQVYPPLADKLWRNRGDGTFEDVTAKAGLLGREGAGLGIVAADFDGDGWCDFLVANDGMVNFLWLNQRNGRFKECALERGCALNNMGAHEANMGVVAADFDGDSDNDILITHLDGEKNTLWENWDGKGHFTDISASVGIDGPTRPFTGFGLIALDYDNDGWLDHAVANGSVRVMDEQSKTGVALPMLQHAQLFRNAGKGRFTEITDEPAFKTMEIGRGLAAGDVDNDGDVDLVVTANNGPARLLLNQVDGQRNWLGVRLVAPEKQGARDPLGATLVAEISDGRHLHRRVQTDGSYASASDPRIIFGLGERGAKLLVNLLRVTWPDGKSETWSGLENNRYHTLVQGTGSSSNLTAVSTPVIQ